MEHLHFSEISLDQIIKEIVESKTILEQQLNKRIEAFSFPYGDSGKNAQKTSKLLEKAGYKAAFLFAVKPIKSSIEDHFTIARVAVGPDTVLSKALLCDMYI